MKSQRVWDNRFVEVAKLISNWSTCMKQNRHVGAVIVKNNRILTTGYNGAPSNIETCLDKGICHKCIAEQNYQEFCYAVHAEQNAIAQAAKLGISINDSTLYCTHSPCTVCAKSIINSGIKRIVYLETYPDKFAMQLLKEANIEVIQLGELECLTHHNL